MKIPLLERFEEKVIKEPYSGCWLWTGCQGRGYGQIWIDGKMRVAHRVYYELVKGPVPHHLTLDHLCRVRSCVNPAHLEVVTLKENCLRGVSESAINAKKTHCVKGHLLSDENLVQFNTTRRYYRRCKLCERMRDRRRRGWKDEELLRPLQHRWSRRQR